MKYIALIEFNTLNEALEFNVNRDYSHLTKVFDKYFLYKDEYEIKNLDHLLEKNKYEC